ncbi:integrase, catalytic region, zinc finger, CCHC-type containing protein [Tanacetum coccineum]
MLILEKEKISNDSKDIQANLLKRIKILKNNFKRSQAQSIDFELKLQHQKEKNACDISWKSKMAKLNGENVSLNIQIESLVQEREKNKLEYQKLFNSIKMTRGQHQQEVNELIENVNQKTYAYGDVRAKNKDLLMTISKLKAKLKIAKKEKNVNTKSKRISQNQSLHVLHLKMRVVSSSSVRRPESKNTNLKKRVLLNTKSKSTSKDVKETQSSVTLVSNKCDTLNSNLSKSNTHVLKVKTVNAMNDGSNHVCVSCGTDVFMISHDKCVARYALSSNSRVKRALFTSHVAAKSSKLGATPVIAKSRFSVATPPKATNKVSRASSLSDLARPLDFCFGNDHFTAITGYGDYVQGNLKICHVYYVKGLEHNLFSVGQFCNGDLEVAFRSNTCYIRNLEGENLLTSSRDSALYTISISEMAASSPVCLMSKATSTKSWLWHRRLSHLNFGTINHLTKQDLVDGLPKFKYDKDHLCSACEQEKSKKATLSPKLVPSIKSKLELIHMDLYRPMRVESSNPKGPGFNCSNFQDSLEDSNVISSKEDLDNLFGPLYKEYYETRTTKVSDNFATNTLNNEDTYSSSSIIIEDHEAPQLVSLLEELITNEPSTSVSNNHSNKLVQEAIAELKGNTFINPFHTPMLEKLNHLLHTRIHQICTNSTKTIAQFIYGKELSIRASDW